MTSTPPLFELTDPVIHYSSGSGRRQVFGRSDRGKKGMQDFFKTHQCSELCRAVRRTWVRRGGGQGPGLGVESAALRMIQAALSGLDLK